MTTTSVTPNKEFRIDLEDRMEICLKTEVRDYLNKLWLDSPNSFDVDETMLVFMDYISEHFRMTWVYE